jgi:hypothetical protein
MEAELSDRNVEIRTLREAQECTVVIDVAMRQKPEINPLAALFKLAVEMIGILVAVHAAVDHDRSALGAVDDIGHHLCTASVCELKERASAEIQCVVL